MSYWGVAGIGVSSIWACEVLIVREVWVGGGNSEMIDYDVDLFCED